MKQSFPFMQIDAFTDKPLSGNPCAVLFDTDSLDESEMLAIAKEMNLSETSFLRQSSIADFGARYFTPAEEIPLAGHPTIATVFALVESGMKNLDADNSHLTIELINGPINIDILSEHGVIQRITMQQRKPQFLSVFQPEDVLPIFGLSNDDLLPGYPIQTVSTGTPQLMIPVSGHRALKKINLDINGYSNLKREADFFSPHIFCLKGATHAGDTFARHFGVPPDTLEDPFTGSATGGMAAYLWHYELISKNNFIAEQGHWMDRPGSAYVEIEGPPDAIEYIRVGGKAALTIKGTFYC